MHRIAAVSTLFSLSVVMTACGGGSMTGGAVPISVSISPTSLSVPTAQARTFTATVKNDASNRGVTWSLSGTGCTGAACGALSDVTAIAATYTAPSTVPVPPDVTLNVTAVADTSKAASAGLKVFAAGTILVAITPTSPSVETHASIKLTATVTNDPDNGGVTWTMTEAGSYCSVFPCGKLSPTSTASGAPTTYTAPGSIISSGPHLTMTATSMTDPTVSASVPMKITCATSTDCIP